jgi:hypothetical protein
MNTCENDEDNMTKNSNVKHKAKLFLTLVPPATHPTPVQESYKNYSRECALFWRGEEKSLS